ncbi:MAG: hypothetical protein ABIH39_00350 [Candidatus Margulisiibacteriota bacterium]
MKKYTIIFLCLALLITFTVSASAREQTHRLGFKAGLYSPTGEEENITGLEAEVQFDAIIHDNVDAGPHFGVFLKNVKGNISSTEDSKFIVVPVTFQFRFYPFYSEEKGATHGIIAPYLAVSAGYYFALLFESNSLDAHKVPDGVGGFGGTAALGIDFGFGPSTAYFVELSYRRTGLRSMREYELDLDGYTFSIGGRF